MNKNKIREAMPTVLFMTGIVGIFVSEVMCARDTLKAEKILTGEIKIKMADDNRPEPYADNAKVTMLCNTKPQYVKEVVKATWKCYIPTAVATTVTLAALIASNRLTKRQIALLSSAVASGGALVQKYRKEILDRTNPEILSEIDKAVAKAAMEESKPVYIDTPTLVSHKEDEFPAENDVEYLFFDPFTNIKFKTTRLQALAAKYYINRNFAIGSAVAFEQFYNFLGVELPEPYRQLGWELGDDYDSAWIDIDFVRSDEPDPETGEPYYIIEYPFEPMYPQSYFPYGNPVETEGSHAILV